LWITGNHDVNVQGNFPVDPASAARAASAQAAGGTRDYRLPGAPVVRGPQIADAGRALLSRQDLFAKIAGHAPGAYAREQVRAFYTIDVAGSPVRLLAVDTAAETGGADGVIHRVDVERFVVPELARAAREGKWLIVLTHHASDRLSDGASPGGRRQS